VSLSGKIQTMPLPDILQFIGLGRKTGVLRVVDGRSEKELVFDGGFAVWCSSNNPKEYLGQHLLARTSLTEADLEAAFRKQRSEQRPLGEVLVASGKIGADELERVLHRKIEDAMYELFTWASGDFSFSESELSPDRVPLRIQLPWESLIMEGARRSDEMAVIRTRIPNDSVRFVSVPARFPEGFPRSGGDRKLIALVDRNVPVDKILSRFHVSDFDILSRLSELCREGLLTVVASSADEDSGPDRNELLAQGSKLLAGKLFLEALELFRTGVSRFPADASFADGLAAVEAQLHQAYADQDGLVPDLCIPLDELQSVELDAQAGFVISRVNGQWNLRSIAQICPFDEADVLAIVHALKGRGLISVGVPAATR
jgi:hypothetical protein